ncbi:Golgi-associated olfactory signaling regulator [Monodelphis domestica]|uniref:Golgi associated olfactory signaling regulator n=1 Tax=Monodelphis domestica TaxID=13616 RepID=A0A5F8H2X2_MONDO|nr:Golgi-associated olfactory signaling regulator [Monodelphis domestica]
MRSLWFFSVFLLLRLGSPGSEAAPSAPPPPEPSKTYDAEGGVVLGAPSASETPAPTPEQSGSPEAPRSIPPHTSQPESAESPSPAPPGSARPESPKASDSIPTATSQAGSPEGQSPRSSGTPDSSAVLSESPASPRPGLSGTSDFPAQTSSPEPPGSLRNEPSETAGPAPETPSSEPPGLGQAETLSLPPPESSPGPPPSASETARAAPSPAPPEPSQMGSPAAPSLGSAGSPAFESSVSSLSGSPEISGPSATPKGPQDPPPAAARLLEAPAGPEPPARLRPLQRRRGSDTVNTIIVVERVQETGVTLVGRPRGATGGALCLFLAGAGLLLGVFLLLWCLYRRAARSRPFGHHRLPDDGDELALHLDTPKDPYDLHFYAPDAWVPSHIATKQPPSTPPLPPKLPPPPGRASSPPRLEPLSPAALPNNFV